MSKKIFLIDAYAMIYRAFYSFISNPMMNSKGESTSAVYGFVNSLQDIIKKEAPSHIAVCFDPPFPTFRNILSPEYKAQRPPTPEGIKTSIPYIKQILDAWGIHRVEVPEYEADDTIGTLAKKAEAQGFQVFMVTPDKDYNQLLSDNVLIYRPKKGAGVDIITAKSFTEENGLEDPKQFIDILALWGDAADNVKGVTGIGEKTSYKLIQQYKSLEGIYDNIDKLKGKQKENFINDRETALLAKKLVTICTEAPVDFVEDDFVQKSINENELRAIFARLEFKTLADRIIGKKAAMDFGQDTLFGSLSNQASNPQPQEVVVFDNVKTVAHEYILVNDMEKLDNLGRQIQELNEFCFDTETTGLTVRDNKLVGLSISWESHKAYYIPFDPANEDEVREKLGRLAPAMQNPAIKKVGQNIKFDILVLKQYGVEVAGDLFDTMVAHYLLQPEQKHNMDYLSEVYLKYTPVHIEQLIGEKGKQISMSEVPIAQITEYAAEDADVTWQLYLALSKELDEAGMTKLATDIEMPLIYVLADMEYTGVCIDSDFLSQYTMELNEQAIAKKLEIYSYVTEEKYKDFNIASPKQLGEVLFEHLKIDDKPKVTKTGQYSTSEDELMKYKDKHPIINAILDYRGLVKLVSTYTEALPQLVNRNTGRIHTSFNQTVTATGRLSSTNPNIQNIPIRTPEGKKVRAAFVPSKGNLMFAADYSQVELRVMAHCAGDENMISAFQSGEDIHRSTAARIFGVDSQDITREQRSLAKSANFGIIYGISAFGLSQDTGLSRTEAKAMIDNYFATYPGIRKYIDDTIADCKKNGYVTTMFGHRRNLPDINSRNFNVQGAAERLAVNTPIQGSAAEIIKIAMINIHREFQQKNLDSKLLIQVHDELVFDVVPGEKDLVEQIVVNQMESAAQLKVHLKVEGKFANNWLDAH
ncbi:MAG: DNA polymerase I [Bacteroidales bacterium]|nr:DNA polymerase I [Bacteroidales bacterium]